jgi:hypothetical protein
MKTKSTNIENLLQELEAANKKLKNILEEKEKSKDKGKSSLNNNNNEESKIK